MITELQYEELLEDILHPLNFLWWDISTIVTEDYAHAPDCDTFNIRREAFFWILERLLREGRIRLGDNPKVLLRPNPQVLDNAAMARDYLADGSIEEQLERMKQAFPHSDEAVDMGGGGVWFFTPACPYFPIWNAEKLPP